MSLRKSAGVIWLHIAVFMMVAFSSFAQSSQTGIDQLHQAFIDPPHDFSPMPFWFWNGKMESPVIQQEIRDMVGQHVYGAFLHGRDGLQTPYLSEDWFKAFEAGLEQSKKSGFEFNFVDEYDWPSGEARNVWMTGNHQSEVLAKRPDFRMKTLAYTTKIVEGPAKEDISIEQDSQAIVAARWLGHDRIDDSSLTAISQTGGAKHIEWTVPEGQWVIVQFSLKPAMGFDGGFVDLMNAGETSLFFDLVYGEYHRRFAPYFGDTIRYSFSDHEGDYGYRIAWTSTLFEAFNRRAGYDLRSSLPLLIFDGGDRTAKVRTDYLATVNELYGHSFWDGITKSAATFGISRTGHAWEESLQWSAALQGSLFTVERGLNPVGVDSLLDWGRQSLNFKVAQSVADFEGRRFACENQGVQGTGSYLDMEGIRKGTNPIGAWGVNLFIPHAFDYDAGRANYPPDWLHQPYWPYFHYYADYTRRISYMNADGRHAVNLLLYYPIDTIWADSKPLFSGLLPYDQVGKPAAWKNQTILTNDYYTRIVLGLSEHQWDFDIADDQYLASARVEGNEMVIGPQRFRAIILPPVTNLSRTTLKKLEEFQQAGGLIFAVRRLPTGSPESGEDDEEIKTGIHSIFAPANKNAYYIDDSVDSLIDALDDRVPKDVRISSGPQEHLYVQHRSKLGTDYYWIVNDADRPRINLVHFSAKGTPEKWDALSGKIEPLFYVNTSSGTDVRLSLNPWDAFYVVFRPQVIPQKLQLEATNAEIVNSLSDNGGSLQAHIAGPASQSGMFVEVADGKQLYRGEVPGNAAEPLALDGNWKFKPAPDRISVPYARVNSALRADGVRQGWLGADFDDTDWSEYWLSEEQSTVRKWQLIGPFPNKDNDGFAHVYPPEVQFDAGGKYDGENGQLSWQTYDSNEPYLALGDWDMWMKTHGGTKSDSGYIVDFNPELQTDEHDWILSYAHTYLYSPRQQRAQIVIAADNWASVWLNHKQVFARLRTPFWYELNSNWADRVSVDLHEGWNEVLVKVGKGRGTSSGFYGFSFRVTDGNGAPLPNLVANTSPSLPGEERDSKHKENWYRVEIPPGCIAVIPPHLRAPYGLFINGEELRVDDEEPIALQKKLRPARNVLVLVTRSDEPLVAPLQFVTGETKFALTSWTKTGLANFSGTAVYENHFTLPKDWAAKYHAMLDLGRVSSVADVTVNGEQAGTLVWSPYKLDITKLLQPGDNVLKIEVTNTEANRRAVGTWRHILGQINICGMEGPVRLIPYVDQVVALHPSASPGEVNDGTQMTPIH